MRLLADASLPGLPQAFPEPFEISVYHHADEIPSLLNDQQILLCRSTVQVNASLLQGHSLRYVATASSGIDHIDSLYLHNNSIELIDAKGSNAIAVADYVIASLAFLQKHQGFSGSKAAVIGVGAIGTQVINRLQATGMAVLSYDPLKADSELGFSSSSLTAITQCDLIAIHANLHTTPPYPSYNLVNELFLNHLKPGVAIINAARGGIVNEEALLQHKKPLLYCTDVYSNEPSINRRIVAQATLCTPHIAGHSVEAKSRAVALVSQKLHASLHLRPPKLNPPTRVELRTSPSDSSWQSLALSLYNPIHETNRLKAADDLALTFQSLRKAHQKRHDFCNYELQNLDEQTQKILSILADHRLI